LCSRIARARTHDLLDSISNWGTGGERGRWEAEVGEVYIGEKRGGSRGSKVPKKRPVPWCQRDAGRLSWMHTVPHG
jgi:hypothetical protein